VISTHSGVEVTQENELYFAGDTADGGREPHPWRHDHHGILVLYIGSYMTEIIIHCNQASK